MKRTRALVDELRSSDRRCNGGATGVWCGKPATVVCTKPDGLQWYACDASEHHDGAATMPIAAWWQLVADSIENPQPKKART